MIKQESVLLDQWGAILFTRNITNYCHTFPKCFFDPFPCLICYSTFCSQPCTPCLIFLLYFLLPSMGSLLNCPVRLSDPCSIHHSVSHSLPNLPYIEAAYCGICAAGWPPQSKIVSTRGYLQRQKPVSEMVASQAETIFTTLLLRILI